MNKEEIEKALDDIRPMLMADGGNVELVDFSDSGTVKLRLTGACSGCPSSQVTLKMGIEQALKEKVPGVQCVESVM